MDKITRERFEARIDKSGDCWIWTGARQGPDSYGRFRYDGKVALTHRLSYELANGPIEPGLQICHTCDNPPCVRPDHLFAGTRSENMRDASRKNRIYRAWKKRCVNGHDLDEPGVRKATGTGCAICHRNRNREWMRQYRDRRKQGPERNA